MLVAVANWHTASKAGHHFQTITSLNVPTTFRRASRSVFLMLQKSLVSAGGIHREINPQRGSLARRCRRDLQEAETFL